MLKLATLYTEHVHMYMSYLIEYHKSRNFIAKNIFVVDGSYENSSYENTYTLLTLMW